jgi:Domain of unknown function (DUF4129)
MRRGTDEARELAKKILAEKRFHPSARSAPLRRPLTWLGRQVMAALAPIGRLFALLLRPLFTSPILGGLVLVALIAGLFVATRKYGGRRVQLVSRATLAAAGDAPVDPKLLEQQADEAAARGDHEAAVRLRFQAGLNRLAKSGRIPESEVTNGEVRSQLRAPDFDELADDFDEIVYGGRPATSDDSTESRSRWPRLTGSSR